MPAFFSNGNRIASVIIIALAIWIFFESKTIVTGFNEAVGPGAFPRLVSICMFVLGTGLFFFPGEYESLKTRDVYLRQTLLILLLCLFALLIKPLGFILSAVPASVLLIKLFSASWKQALISGTVLSLLLYALFEYALGIPLPGMPSFFTS